MQFRVIVVTDPHRNPHTQTGLITIHCTTASMQCNNANNVESAENANSAIWCSKQMLLNCQSLISAKSYHLLKCLSAHVGLVTF